MSGANGPQRMLPTREVELLNLERSLLRSSFYDFVQRFWPVVETADPVWNWHIREVCGVLQEAAEPVFRGERRSHDVLLNVPPGSTKSLMATVMFPAWVWTRMAHAQLICASYAQDLALKLSLRCRDVILSDKWGKLFPDVALRDDQQAKGFFENTHKGWRYSVGTNGSVTGFHGHFLIVDDPLDPNRAYSQADLKTANRWVSETLSRRKVDSKVTVTVLVMQRLHEDDPSAIMLRKSTQRGGAPVKWVNLPAEVQGRGLDVVHPRRLAKFYTQDPQEPKSRLLDPVRLGRAELLEAQVALGQYGYAGQMLQQPAPPGGGMFKVERILVDSPPPRGEFVRRVRAWDKAGTQDGGAFTAGVLMARDKQGRFWVLDVVRGQWDSGAREAIIHQTALQDGPLVEVAVEQEPGSGGKESAQGTLKRLAGFRVRIERPTGDKVLRADPYSVQVNGQNVSAGARVDGREPATWWQVYKDELQHFPVGRYKDQVDASSLAFSLLAQLPRRVGGFFRANDPSLKRRHGNRNTTSPKGPRSALMGLIGGKQ